MNQEIHTPHETTDYESYLNKAKKQIAEAKDTYSKSLTLNGLNLNTEAVNRLIPRIKELQNLETLSLINNQLEAIPSALCELTNLKTLLLASNKLTTVPNEICQLRKLKEIDLGHNQFKGFPNALCQLKGLKKVFLVANGMTSVSGEIPLDMKNLQHLISLNLSHNKLTEIPPQVCDLPALEGLYCQNNHLVALPEHIHQLKCLKFLNVENNHLTALPEYIHQLQKLKYLDCNNNRLDALPTHTVTLPEDCQIHIANNPVENTSQVLDDYRMAQRTYGSSGHLINTYKERDQFVKAKLQIMYPDHCEPIFDQMEEMTQMSFPWGVQEPGQSINDLRSYTARDTLKKFIIAIPDTTDFDKEVYLKNSAVALLSPLWSASAPHLQSESNQKNLIATMAVALGNCETPIQSLLIQKYIAVKCQEEQLNPQTKALIAREAIEQKIITSSDIPLYKVEEIEQVQGLLNALFSPNENPKYSYLNKVKIAGKLPILPPKTENYAFAFESVRPKTATAFAHLLCKTNPSGKLEIQDGKYQLDLVKYRQITEPYLAKLGIVSDIEKQISHYLEAIQENLAMQELVMNYYNKEKVAQLFVKEEVRQEIAEEVTKAVAKVFAEVMVDNEVIALLNLPKQANTLRTRLYHLDDTLSNSQSDSIEAYTKVTQHFLSEQTSKAQKILTTIESAKQASEMSTNKTPTMLTKNQLSQFGIAKNSTDEKTNPSTSPTKSRTLIKNLRISR